MCRLTCAEQRRMNMIFNIYLFSLSHIKCTVKTATNAFRTKNAMYSNWQLCHIWICIQLNDFDDNFGASYKIAREKQQQRLHYITEKPLENRFGVSCCHSSAYKKIHQWNHSFQSWFAIGMRCSLDFPFESRAKEQITAILDFSFFFLIYIPWSQIFAISITFRILFCGKEIIFIEINLKICMCKRVETWSKRKSIGNQWKMSSTTSTANTDHRLNKSPNKVSKNDSWIFINNHGTILISGEKCVIRAAVADRCDWGDADAKINRISSRFNWLQCATFLWWQNIRP